jgi:hypothetical protein
MAQGFHHLIVNQMVNKFPIAIKCVDVDLNGITAGVCIEFSVFAASLLCIENGVKEDACVMGCDALYCGRQL